jgi:hypothetical protein
MIRILFAQMDGSLLAQVQDLLMVRFQKFSLGSYLYGHEDGLDRLRFPIYSPD